MPLLITRVDPDSVVGINDWKTTVTYLHVPGHARSHVRLLVARIAAAAVVCLALIPASGGAFGALNAVVVLSMVTAILAMVEVIRIFRGRHTIMEKKRAPMTKDAPQETTPEAETSAAKPAGSWSSPMQPIATPNSIVNCHLTFEERMRSYAGEPVTVKPFTIAEANALADAETVRSTERRPSGATLH